MGIYENFDEQKQFACRVIADHARATAFAIADGILPGNQDRNYVLRKIMRRAIYHGREHLGFQGLFFYKVCDFVVGEMKDAYPELETQREFIGKMVRLEEERFGNTITVGLKKLDELFSKIGLEQKSAIMCSTDQVKNMLPGSFDLFKSGEVKEFFDSENFQKFESEYLQPNESRQMIEEFLPFMSQFANEMSEDPEILTNMFEDANSESLEFYKELAKLYDTFGTPRDLIRVKLEEFFYLSVSEEEFNEKFDTALQELQNQSGIGKTQQNEKINPIYKSLERTSVRSNFQGYETTKVEDAKVLAIVKDDQEVEQLNEGDEGLIVLDETPFYAEAGGQVGDRGILVRTAYGSGRLNASGDESIESQVKPPATAGGSDIGGETSEGSIKPPATAGGSDMATAIVIDTFAPIPGITLHKSKVKSGSIKVGDSVTATVDVEKRDATRRNHTATHLVHAALKEVLGTHVKQAGSVVAPNYLRFDFTHYQAMSDVEIKEVEDLVNHYILQNEPVNTDLMAIEEAMRTGAVAMFGEKYGSEVRVLSVGNGVFSKELCGGTHVRATGDIGSFKIIADEAIASGVRRIRALTGFDAFRRFREDEVLIDKSLQFLKTQRDQLPSAIEKLQDELKKTRKEIEELKLKIATGAIGSVSANGDETKEVNGVNVLAKIVDDLDKSGIRHLSDTLLGKIKSGVVILGREEDGKVSFIVRVSDDLTDRVRAGNIVKEMAPIVGGRGGGKPDMAEGGGTEPKKLSEAIDASFGIIEKMLS